MFELNHHLFQRFKSININNKNKVNETKKHDGVISFMIQKTLTFLSEFMTNFKLSYQAFIRIKQCN